MASSTFDIDLRYSGNPLYLGVFQAAADLWERVVVADLVDISSSAWGAIDDLRIDATVAHIDGSGGILGQAGWDARRSGSLPYHGTMSFDSADVTTMYNNQTLYSVVLHEIGHVLGIGTLWTAYGLVNTSTHQYFGGNALNEYRTLVGTPSATYIPIEDQGGPGTANSHWDEEAFDAELMTGYIEASGTAMPLSRMTIASLADLGYAVDLTVADSYFLPGSGVLNGTSGYDLIWGTSRSEIINGLGGDDVLYGMEGEDKLYGGNGNDILIGGVGSDLLEGGAGVDLASYEYSPKAVRIDLVFTVGVFGDAQNDVLHDIENVFGSAFDDVLIGNSSINQLYGLGGNDALSGGAGADYLDGGSGSDTVYYEQSTAAVQIDLSAHTGRGGNAEGDRIINIENVIGSRFNDTIVGNGVSNRIASGYGQDMLSGGSGFDTFVFRPGFGNGDTIVDFQGNGGADGDKLVFEQYGLDASFSRLDYFHWQVSYHNGAEHDIIMFLNGAAGAIHPNDYALV